MKNQRIFSLEYKRWVAAELLSGESRPAQIYRRHNINLSVIYHWKKQYSRGKFNNEPTEEAALRDRIEKLERLVDRLTLENEFLKRAGITGSAIPNLSDHRGAVHNRWVGAFSIEGFSQRRWETHQGSSLRLRD